jgi:hypothetical protein
MALSEAQLSANRANAQKSTGPRTPEGKDTSRLNATRHGITQQVMVMPAPQMQAYLDFNKEQHIAHAAANPIERQLVQTIIDTQWRLNLARNLEFALFADNYDKSEGLIETDRPELEAAMLAPRTLSSKLNELKLISLYEQRHNRTLQTTMKQLEEMQSKRKERERMEMFDAARIERVFQMQGLAYNPADDGFVFSTKRFATYKTREQHRREALIAEKVGFNLQEFRAAVAKQ